MNKKHLLWWIFDFLHQKYPNVLTDMKEQLAGDAGEEWVKAGLAERLAAFEEVSPAGYKFLAEYQQPGSASAFKDLVVYDPNRSSAEAQVAKHLAGATKTEMIILSHDDLKQLNLQPGQMRTVNGIVSMK